MVEVFKTNVTHRFHADILIDLIHQNFVDYKVNFDLEDCDKILRVKCTTGPVHSSELICLLKKSGFDAEVLQDELPVVTALPC